MTKLSKTVTVELTQAELERLMQPLIDLIEGELLVKGEQSPKEIIDAWEKARPTLVADTLLREPWRQKREIMRHARDNDECARVIKKLVPYLAL